MNKLSIIIPAYEEPFLNQTIKSIFENAVTDIEVIVILDGWKPKQIDGRARVIEFKQQRGMRTSINAGISCAKGEFILKSDAHCLYAQGFDEVLTKNCLENWLVVPRRYTLNEIDWKRKRAAIFYDYHCLSFPYEREWGCMLMPTQQRIYNERKIDNTMTFTGSAWLANTEYFLKHIGQLDDKTYAFFGGEQVEIGLKYWLGGGEVKVNKNTWYAHLGKRKDFHLQTNRLSYNLKRSLKVLRSRELLTKHFVNNEILNMIHPFEWLVEKFWPISGWPENWKELLPKIKYKYL